MTHHERDHEHERMISEVHYAQRTLGRVDEIQEQIERLEQEATEYENLASLALDYAIELAATYDWDADLEDELGYAPEALKEDRPAIYSLGHSFRIGDQVTAFGDVLRRSCLGDGTLTRITRSHAIVTLDNGVRVNVHRMALIPAVLPSTEEDAE